MANSTIEKQDEVTLQLYGQTGDNPLAENGTGVTLKIMKNGSPIGYIVFRPKGYKDGSNRPLAIEAYTANWQMANGIYRDI